MDAAVAAAVNFGITHVDLDGRIIFLDEAYAELIGAAPAELVGRLVSEFTYGDEGNSPEMLINIVVRTGQPLIVRRVFRNLITGAPVECDVQLCLIRGGDGCPSGILGVAQRAPSQAP